MHPFRIRGGALNPFPFPQKHSPAPPHALTSHTPANRPHRPCNPLSPSLRHSRPTTPEIQFPFPPLCPISRLFPSTLRFAVYAPVRTPDIMDSTPPSLPPVLHAHLLTSHSLQCHVLAFTSHNPLLPPVSIASLVLATLACNHTLLILGIRQNRKLMSVKTSLFKFIACPQSLKHRPSSPRHHAHYKYCSCRKRVPSCSAHCLKK